MWLVFASEGMHPAHTRFIWAFHSSNNSSLNDQIICWLLAIKNLDIVNVIYKERQETLTALSAS